mmetsp:Transcript_33399/g.71974  ORF Transcript_33399/g.71974 Transcript_33399/m.71974 type:complete len:130 (+) Transcript_33399:733-1122(+)
MTVMQAWPISRLAGPVARRLGAVPIGIWAAVAPAEPLAGPLPLVGQLRAASTLCTIPAEDLLMAVEDLFTMEVLFTMVVVSFTWSTTMLCTMVEQRCKRPRCQNWQRLGRFLVWCKDLRRCQGQCMNFS